MQDNSTSSTSKHENFFVILDRCSDNALKFNEIKLHVKKEFNLKSVLKFSNNDLLRVAEKINSNEMLASDFFLDTFHENIQSQNWDKYDEFSEKLLYEWFGPCTFVENLFEIGILIMMLSQKVKNSSSY